MKFIEKARTFSKINLLKKQGMLKICSDFLQTLICKVEYLLNVLFCEHFFICMVTIIQNLQFSFLRSCDLTQPLIVPRRLRKRHDLIRTPMLQKRRTAIFCQMHKWTGLPKRFFYILQIFRSKKVLINPVFQIPPLVNYPLSKANGLPASQTS